MTEQQIDVWTIDLRVPDDDIARLSGMLSLYERARAARLTGEHARRTTAGRAALRTVLGRYLDVEPAQIGYEFGTFGKPRLARRFESDVTFNLTDSHDVALVAVSRGREVGIDIEYHKPGRDGRRIARRRFDPDEAAQLDTLDDDTAARAFVEAWTRKEAYLKAVGTGLRGGLRHFTVSILPSEPPRIVRCPDPDRWTVFTVDVPHGFAASVVAENAADCSLKAIDGGQLLTS